MGVVLGRLVEGRRDDLALDGAAHVGDLFWSLTNEADHQGDLGVVRRDALSDLLQQARLTGLRWRDDQGALPLAERVDKIDKPL